MKPKTTFRRSEALALGALLAGGCVVRNQGTAAPRGAAVPDVAGADAASAPRAAGALGFNAPASLTSGAAFIRYAPDERAWTIGNEEFEERLELRSLPDAESGSGGAVRLARRYLQTRSRQIHLDVAEVTDESGVIQDALGIELDGQPPALVPLDQHLEQAAGGVILATIRFRAADYPAELTAEVRLRPGFGVVEHRASITYTGTPPLRLTRLDAADFVVRSGEDARWRAATIDTEGNVSFVRLGREGALEAETPAQSAARSPVVPLLVLHDAAGEEGMFFGLRWSSNYRIAARSLGDRSVGIEAGVRMTGDPEVDPRGAVRAEPGFPLVPNQHLVGPWLILGFFDGTMEDASNALTAYLTADRPREPRWAAEVMPVAWNSWFAYGTGVDYATMLAEAKQAHELGVEVFYVDYGWSAAQGDWTPHPQRFPAGGPGSLLGAAKGAPGQSLPSLADAVHRLGMRFGLWVAFGVAEADSDLLKRHPDFVARQPIPARTGIDGSLPLCLTRAQSWVQSELARIVRTYKLDWLKFDQPMVAACRNPSHGHDPSVRGSLEANNLAFYDILRTLRDQFPELFVESTFDGAGYLDYGVFARSHAAWLDDAAGDPSVPMSVVQQSFYGASLAFPARFLTLWLARGPVGPGVVGRGVSPADLAYQGYSTMGGSWGLSLRLGDLDAEQRRVVTKLIEDYHTFRRILPGAQLYHLAPPLAVPLGSTQGPAIGDWFALQYIQPETRRGAVLAVRNAAGPERLTLKLRGLTPGSPYQVAWSDGRGITEDVGAALMQDGIVAELPPYSGGLIWVTPTG